MENPVNAITRREFLVSSGKGMVGAAVAGRVISALAQDRVKGANEKVMLALIGAGSRGTSVIQGLLKNNQNVEAKYVCDINDERGAEAITSLTKQQGYAPKRINDMRQIFEDKDVYVEKCSSTTIWEGRKLVEAAEKYQRIVEIGTQNRSADYGWSARDYVHSGQVGKG